MPLSRLLLLLAVAACAAPPEPGVPSPAARAELGPLPASFINTPSCSGCLAVTVTLRADGAYTVRERVGSSEFYDFGAWRETDGILHLAGGRDALRRYRLAPEGLLEAREGTPGGDLRRAAEPESLRGPFRMLGRYDGEVFQECRTGLSWALEQTRAAQALREELAVRQVDAALVAVDASFVAQPGREVLRVFRTASVLNQRGCPG